MNSFTSQIVDMQNANASENYQLCIEEFNSSISKIKNGGGKASIQKQHNKNRLTARERIENLIDNDCIFFELGIFAAYGMYDDVGCLLYTSPSPRD